MRLPRTTNNCEGFHSGFNKILGVCHPNIFELIKAMKRCHAVNYQKLVDYAKGKEKGKKKYKTATDDMIAVVSRCDPNDKMATLQEIAKKLKNFDPSKLLCLIKYSYPINNSLIGINSKHKI